MTVPSAADLAATVREALTREHRAGSVLKDRGDGLHWLACVDCGTEWAENDDGSFGAGELQCEHAALAALDALLARCQNAEDELALLQEEFAASEREIRSLETSESVRLGYTERVNARCERAEHRVAALEQELKDLAEVAADGNEREKALEARVAALESALRVADAALDEIARDGCYGDAMRAVAARIQSEDDALGKDAG